MKHKAQDRSIKRMRFALWLSVGFYILCASFVLLPDRIPSTITIILMTISVLLFSAIAYFFIHKMIRTDAKSLSNTPQEINKYGNNRLPPFIKAAILHSLNENMRKNKPWLNISLTLNELAEIVNVNTHHLSQVINCEFGKSFHAYVNEFRLEHACNLLVSTPGMPVIKVALASGFSSKSTFNMIFKKHTGLTPSEYRKRYCIEEECV